MTEQVVARMRAKARAPLHHCPPANIIRRTPAPQAILAALAASNGMGPYSDRPQRVDRGCGDPLFMVREGP